MKQKNQYLFWLSVVIWACNVVLAVVSYWVPSTMDFLFPFTVIVMVQAFLSFCKHPKLSISEIPAPTRRLCLLSIVYSLANFLLCMYILREGGPGIQDGVYCLENHGKFVRTLTPAEYHYFCTVEARFFFGYWLAFTAMSMGIRAIILEE